MFQVPPWDCQWRETGLRRFYAAKDTVESAKGIAKTMLIDRLQSLIAVSFSINIDIFQFYILNNILFQRSLIVFMVVKRKFFIIYTMGTVLLLLNFLNFQKYDYNRITFSIKISQINSKLL